MTSKQCNKHRLIAFICVLSLVLSLFPVGGYASNAFANPVNTSRDNQESTYSAELETLEALEADYEPGELIVVYKDEVSDVPTLDKEVKSESGATTTLSDEGVVEQEEIDVISDEGKTTVVTLADDSEEAMAEAIESIAALDDIAYVEPNYKYTMSAAPTPNDTYYSNQYYLTTCDFSSAWATSKTEGALTVAVIDTGCNLKHADLQGQLDVTYAYDAVEGELLSSSGVANNGDKNGHGTAVCGIVGAQTNNGQGIAGASWNASILPIRIFDEKDEATSDYLIRALSYIDNLLETGKLTNIRVINMSIGSSGDSITVRKNLEHLYSSHNILNVAAGGNGDSHGNPITSYTYPSDYDCCVSVTSTTKEGAQPKWADYNDAKDIAAPGVYIYSTLVSGNCGYYGASSSGTSFSAPIVSGAAALMFASYPSASPYDIVKAMQQTATAVLGQPASSGSAGQLNASLALSYLESHITGKNPSSGIGTLAGSISGISMYRMYNPSSGEHLYTSDANERNTLSRKHGWIYEGIGWVAPSSGNPVYRLYNPFSGDHHYTTDLNERNTLVRYHGWRSEGVGWYSGGITPVYRQFSPNAFIGTHNYTTSKYENDVLSSRYGWIAEGVGWYALSG